MNPATRHEEKSLYEFGPFRLDPSERVLARNGERVWLAPKAFDTLFILVKHSGHVLTKDELMKTLWPGSFVEENNLNQQISQVRRALGDGTNGQSYIETVPKLGYRFIPDVREIRDGDSSPAFGAEGEVVLSKLTRTHVILRELEEQDETDNSASNTDATAAHKLRSRISAVIAVSITAAATAAALIVLLLLNRQFSRREQAAFVPAPKLIRLTTDGKAQQAAVSPDGKYVAYVSGDPGNQSLWLRQVATHSDIQILPPLQAAFGGITFSHDGNFLYYTARQFQSQAFSVYRIPALGGEPKKVADRVLTTASLSPDDQRIVYARSSDRTAASQLYISGSGGEGRRQLTSDNDKFLGLAAPAWSPDGARIAAGVWSAASGTKKLGVWIFDASNGSGRPIGPQNWTDLDSLAWLPDGKALVMTASETSSGPAGQVWELSYPAGEFHRITNDLTDYSGASLTADANTVATVGTEVPSNVWVSPAANPDAAQQITSGSVGFGGWSDLAWTADGKLVYYSVAGGNQELWTMDADGTHPRRLTSSPGWKLQPSPCPDGRTVVFTLISGATVNLWIADADGGNLKQLTFSNSDEDPTCSADSNWVVFSGDGKLRKISTRGGASIEFANLRAWYPVISPDGKWVASLFSPEPEQEAIAVLSFNDGTLATRIPLTRDTLAVASAGKLQWTPDGKALAYVKARGGVSNLWSQPLDGSPAKPLTNFQTGQIFSFAWSRDGKQLALTRGTVSSDVILISNLPH